MRTLASELRAIAHDMMSGPRVYVDANVPAGIVATMRRDLRWDVLFVLEHDDLRRASDRVHFSRAVDLGRTLVTQDHDFLDDRRFPPALGPGVLVCCASDERTFVRLLHHAHHHVFAGGAGADLAGRKIVLTVDMLHALG
jgi:hypothetical protein